MFYFFKPSFPVTKKMFIKSFLGFVAINLRKKLKEVKDDKSYFLEADYIVEAKKVVDEELDHLINRLKEVGLCRTEKETSKT